MGTLPMIPAREVLTIVWQGEFHPGVIAYGLRRQDSTSNPLFPSGAWPVGTEVEEFRLTGDAWEVVRWDILVVKWPNPANWPDVIRQTLSSLLQSEAVVAWLGQEGGFCDPPYLFDPECMTGAVFAALTSDIFLCPLDPDEPLRSLSDQELAQLRMASGGLASAR